MITIRKAVWKRISPIIFVVLVVLVFVIRHLWFNFQRTFDSTEVVKTNFHTVDDLTPLFYDEKNEIDKTAEGNPRKGNVININLFFIHTPFTLAIGHAI